MAKMELLKDKKLSFPRVDADLAAYDKAVTKMQFEFSRTPADPRDKNWVKRKLDHMFEVDQFMRRQTDIPFKNKYSEQEKEYFWEQFRNRFQTVDRANTRDLKDLLKHYEWFKISEWGEAADNHAWLLVQHADQDVAFQKEILGQLEHLYRVGETKPSNYAYLYDRVATNERRLQRYGTQGQCVGPGRWEPNTLEDPKRVDEFRKSVGLETLEDYKKRFVDICH